MDLSRSQFTETQVHESQMMPGEDDWDAELEEVEASSGDFEEVQVNQLQSSDQNGKDLLISPSERGQSEQNDYVVVAIKRGSMRVGDFTPPQLDKRGGKRNMFNSNFTRRVEQFEEFRKAHGREQAKDTADNKEQEQREETVHSIFRQIQKDLVSRRNGMLAFERRAAGEFGENRPAMKKNNSEKKLIRSNKEIKINNPEPPFKTDMQPRSIDMLDGVIKTIGQLSLQGDLFKDEDARNSDIEIRPRRNSAANALPFQIMDIPQESFQVQAQVSHDRFPAIGLPQSPTVPRRRRTVLAANLDIHLKREDLKKTSLKDITQMKQEKAIPVNPLKPKEFEFKRNHHVEPEDYDDITLMKLDELAPGVLLQAPFKNSMEFFVFIAESETPEEVYARQDITAGKLIQALVATFYEKYKEFFLHPEFSEVYELRFADSDNPTMPDKLIYPLERGAEIREIFERMREQKVTEQRLHLVLNSSMMRRVDERAESYLSVQKKIEQLKKAMKGSLEEHSSLVPVVSPDSVVKCTIVKRLKTEKVYEIFKHMAKKIRNFNRHEYYLVQEYPRLFSLVDQKPLQFTEGPVEEDTLIGDLRDSTIISMLKKVYRDEILADKLLLNKNANSLSVVKSFDQSLVVTKNFFTYSDQTGYISDAAARSYESFPCVRIESTGKRIPFNLGLDLENVYIMDQTRFPDDASQSNLIVERVITPSFTTDRITGCTQVENRFLKISVRLHDDSTEEVFMIQSEKLKQLYHKIQKILSYIND